MLDFFNNEEHVGVTGEHAMTNRTPRLVLTFCSLLLALGGGAHAAAFSGAANALGMASLKPVYANDLKALWLADSFTLWIVAALFAMCAIRPGAAARHVVLTIALIPASTAILIYIFVGPFYAAHLLVGIAVAAALAALRFPRPQVVAASDIK